MPLAGRDPLKTTQWLRHSSAPHLINQCTEKYWTILFFPPLKCVKFHHGFNSALLYFFALLVCSLVCISTMCTWGCSLFAYFSVSARPSADALNQKWSLKSFQVNLTSISKCKFLLSPSSLTGRRPQANHSGAEEGGAKTNLSWEKMLADDMGIKWFGFPGRPLAAVNWTARKGGTDDDRDEG